MVAQQAVILPAPPQPTDQWSRDYANQLYRWMESFQRQVTGFPYLRGSGLFFPENALPTAEAGLVPGTVYLGDGMLLLAGGGGSPVSPGTAYNQGNILGTVTQSGGTPTGALIERGSNANGEYVKFADGTMICTNNNVGSLPTDSASGTLFRATTALTWTYPVAFAAQPSVSAFNAQSASTRWSVVFGNNTTIANIQMWGTTSSATTVQIGAMAVGRWF